MFRTLTRRGFFWAWSFHFLLGINGQVALAQRPLLSPPMRNVVCHLLLSTRGLDQTDSALRASDEFRLQVFGQTRTVEDEKKSFKNLRLNEKSSPKALNRLNQRLRTIRSWTRTAAVGETRSLNAFTVTGERNIRAYFEDLTDLDKDLHRQFYAKTDLYQTARLELALKTGFCLACSLSILGIVPFTTPPQFVAEAALPLVLLLLADPIAVSRQFVTWDQQNDQFRRAVNEHLDMSKTEPSQRWLFWSTTYKFPQTLANDLTTPGLEDQTSSVYAILASFESTRALVRKIHQLNHSFFNGKLAIDRILTQDSKTGEPKLLVFIRSSDLGQDRYPRSDHAAVPQMEVDGLKLSP